MNYTYIETSMCPYTIRFPKKYRIKRSFLKSLFGTFYWKEISEKKYIGSGKDCADLFDIVYPYSVFSIFPKPKMMMVAFFALGRSAVFNYFIPNWSAKIEKEQDGGSRRNMSWYINGVKSHYNKFHKKANEEMEKIENEETIKYII